MSDQKPNICCFENCKKKIKITDFKCRCNKFYCLKHKHPELHNCSYDYKSKFEKDKINLDSCIAKKILKV